MRIIFDVVRDGLSAINTAANQMARAEQQMSTGRRVSGAGDDPLAVQQAIGERATMGAIDAYKRTNASAASRLAAVDSVLTGIGDKLTAASVAGLSGQGSGVSPEARSAAAQRVRSLRDSLVTDLNTTFQGTHLFSGTAANQPAYAMVGGNWTYQGNSATTQVEVEKGRLVSISFDGQAIAQGADSSDMFTMLDDLADAIEAGDNAAISTGLAGVERAFNRTQRALGALGADEQGIDEASARLAALRVSTDVRRASLEDANMAEAVVKLTQAETAYRAALSAVSTAERQSLLDYLR